MAAASSGEMWLIQRWICDSIKIKSNSILMVAVLVSLHSIYYLKFVFNLLVFMRVFRRLYPGRIYEKRAPMQRNTFASSKIVVHWLLFLSWLIQRWRLAAVWKYWVVDDTNSYTQFSKSATLAVFVEHWMKRNSTEDYAHLCLIKIDASACRMWCPAWTSPTKKYFWCTFCFVCS